MLQFSKVSNFLVTLNSSVNFIIYCVCSRDFRTVLHRMLPSARTCCSCSRRRRAQPSPPPIAGPRAAQRRQNVPLSAAPDPRPADPAVTGPDGRPKLAYRAYGFHAASHRRLVKLPAAAELHWD